MPERFLFFGLTELKSAAPQIEGDTLDLVICFSEADVRLERRVQTGNFVLFCTPAVNLFPKWVDEVELAERFTEFEVVPDKTRPLDYEVFDVLRVEGVGDATGKETVFRPFYWSHDADEHAEPTYFALRREQRELTIQEKRFNKSKSKYLGSLVYLSLCDREERVFTEHATPSLKDLTRLRVQALCTNRHLPIQMAVGQGMTDFDLGGSKVESIRFVVGPTAPQPSHAEGETAWRLISSLSLNYLSLLDQGKDGAVALREILSLYCPQLDMTAEKQVMGLRSVKAEPVIRRAQVPGPVAFARGLKISLVFDEDAFSGAGVFLLGAVMARFLGRYVTANAFVETAIETIQRKEIKRWPASIGTRPII
jgi:type VI secretion system protein ImpG